MSVPSISHRKYIRVVCLLHTKFEPVERRSEEKLTVPGPSRGERANIYNCPDFAELSFCGHTSI